MSTSRNKCRPLRASVAVIALLVVTAAYAQDTTSEIDKIFSWAVKFTRLSDRQPEL